VKAKQAGILALILGSTCCIGPLLLVAIGVGSGAVFIGRYHWFFIIAATAVLAWGWANYLREKTVCECEQKPMQGRQTAMFAFLVSTVLVFGFAGLNITRYVLASAPPAPQTQTQLTNGLDRVVIPVDGLSCLACEIPVQRLSRHFAEQIETFVNHSPERTKI
jgi:hypothetical protein